MYYASSDTKAYFSGIGLYKEKYGTYYNYGVKKDIQEIQSGEKNINYYKKDSKVERVFDESGNISSYLYNELGYLTNIKDDSGNEIRYSYDILGNITKTSIITSDQKTINEEFIYDELGNILLHKDKEGSLSSFEYDDRERLILRNDSNGLVTHFEYDDLDNLTHIKKDLETLAINHSFLYNDDRSIKEIRNDDIRYSFNSYDEWGNLGKVEVNNYSINDFLYYNNNNIRTNLVKSKKYPSSSYTFIYDKLNRVSEVLYNNDIEASYKYDDFNLIEVVDNTSRTSYSYEVDGQVIKEDKSTNEYLQTSLLEYDNLGNVSQKSTQIKSSSDTVTLNYNYVHDYEYNEYRSSGYFSRLELAFKEDIIHEDPNGLYGAIPVLSNVDKQKYVFISINIFLFNKDTSTLSYNVSSINKNRTTKLYGMTYFDKEEWVKEFKKNKHIYMWVRLPEITKTSKRVNIMSFATDTKELASVSIDGMGNVIYSYITEVKTNNKVEEVIQEISIPAIKANTWSLIGIGIEEIEDSNNIILHTTLNKMYSSRIMSPKFDDEITRILIGKYMSSDISNEDLTVGSPLDMAFEVLYIGMGAYKHNHNSFRGIYDEAYKYVFREKVFPKTGVIYHNPLIYKDMDVISLNGSLNSMNGLKPLEYTYKDSSFKVNKPKVFKLDRETSTNDINYTNRHVYGSIVMM